MAEGEQKISMQDVSDKAGDAQEAAAPQEDAYAGITLEDAPKETQRPADAVLGKYGNSIGDKIESGLSPIGGPLGKGLGMVSRPVGGLVDPIVGGLMRSGAAFGDAAGVGAGNMDHKRAAEEEERKKPFGGQEQTADNPLGL